MIKIHNKTLCCGCSACEQKCPKHCISMQEDREGFLYPKVNEEDCIDCGICEKVCGELNPYNEQKPLNVYAAINKDEEVRLNSSSGGIFYLLAEKHISEGGVVFGARFDKDWQVILDYSETIENVTAFMGSKYVQARVSTAYKDAELFLKQGRKVLFSGSPCQIAGLYHYLRKDYENLTTVDFVCHGVPSPKVWQRYLDEVVTACKRATNDAKYCNRSNGWRRYKFDLSYDEDEQVTYLSSYYKDNHFMRAFISDMTLRPSCYDCQAKHGRSHSDITIGDFWGVNGVFPEINDDKGTGLLLVNTEKGKQCLDFSRVVCKESRVDVAAKYNGGLSSQVNPHPKRMEFFSNLDKSNSVIALINNCLRPSFIERVQLGMELCKKRIKSSLKIMLGKEKKCSVPKSHNIEPLSIKAAICDINFRNKKFGWKKYRMEISIPSNPQPPS